MNFSILKDWRVALYLVLLIAAIILIIPFGEKGAVVKSVDLDSPLRGSVSANDIITWANEKQIEGASDLQEFENYTGTFRFMRSGELKLVDIAEPGLKIKTADSSPSRLKFGMDLIGGIRVVLQPKENVSEAVVQQVIGALQTRINVFGLREAKFQEVKDVSGNPYVQIEMSGGSRGEVENLLARQGKFEGKISNTINFVNGEANFFNKTLKFSNNSLIVDENSYNANETFELDGINFTFVNSTDTSIYLLGTAFSSADIKSVCIQEQQGFCASRVINVGRGRWEFTFQVFISSEGAERFARLTKDSPQDLQNPGYIESKIILFLDDKPISDLSISRDLAGKPITEPVITGSRTNKEETLHEKLTLQSILQSGALPVQLDIVKVDEVSATLGQGFITSAAIAALVGVFVVSGVVYARYRKIKIALPVVLTSLSEVILILGAASLINWTIDLPAIVAIISVIGTGVDAQIFIIDELLGRGGQQALTFKQKLKNAFFMIFGSASTVIAAMLPLLFIGIGVMRGFAITTIMGVLIGIFITRPAFSKIAERILGTEETKI